MSIRRHILSGPCVLPFASAVLAADEPAGHWAFSPSATTPRTGRAVSPSTPCKAQPETDAVEAVKLLREAGADVNVVPHGPSTRETALHSAALRGWNEMVKLLAGYGANLDAQSAKANLTPLHYALARYQPGFLETKPRPNESTAALLRELGAKLEHPNLPPWQGVPTPTITAAVPE